MSTDSLWHWHNVPLPIDILHDHNGRPHHHAQDGSINYINDDFEIVATVTPPVR